VAWALLFEAASDMSASPPRSSTATQTVTANASAPPAGAFAADTQLNWLARYIPIQDHLTGAAAASLLEVGSGARGLACVLPVGPAKRFVGVDTSFAAAPAPSMIALAYDGRRLPFRDGAFHTVVSMDTLEHVPPAQRPAFITDLARVAASRVILGFPARMGADGDGLDGERFLQALFRALGAGDPDWLHEHEALGLPRADEVEAQLGALDGCTTTRLPTTGGLVNLMAVLLDVLPGARAWVDPVLQRHRVELEAWFRAGAFGPGSRAVYLIERRQPREALVTLTPTGAPGARGSLARGLACPDCDGGLDEPPAASAGAAGLVCAGCQRIFPAGTHGIVSLTPSPGPVTFHLAPTDWLGTTDWIAPVHNYLCAFPAGAACRLWIDVDPAQLSAAEAVDLLQPVLAPLGDRPFAEIYLNDDTRERPRGARVIALRPRAGGTLFDFTAAWFRAQAGGATAAEGPRA
jgi:hypothetical protein